MDKTFVLLLNRGAPDYYPGELVITQHPDFFQNGYIFCWFGPDGNEPALYNHDPDNQQYLMDLQEEGLLLVYDGNDLDEIDHLEIGQILKKAIPNGTRVYVCCHANEDTMPLWDTIVKDELGDRLAGWVTFHNHNADRKSQVIHGFLKKERTLQELVTEVFKGRENEGRSKFMDILLLVVYEARQNQRTAGIVSYLNNGDYLSAGQKEEITRILTDIDLQTETDSSWHDLFNYLDELS